ncbi:Putative NAD(P)H nitroreductase YfkO [Caulifigura coniformis]|uniref:NAD(P)H nitroreductase YfkO n=1 Tax=Caulifigura coniformis TaxID=2527983 RepID=A0A517SJX9_9PLAN|nr:NAD(P)H-dependent oxidoreductase [Caulifigura coniformis]QDT56426.1 Putative NAD(P)H nitroreductase YfkO [Caulifigura coniformis]
MSLLKPSELEAQMRWRYACKKFDSERFIPPEMWSALENSLILAPSSFGLQPWKFVVVRTRELKEQLMGASWGQTQVRDCSHLVVFAARHPMSEADVHRFLDRIVHVRGVTRESLAGFQKVMLAFLAKPPEGLSLTEWAARQAYIALGTFMTAAAALGVDTCPLEGIAPAKYDDILGLPALGYHTIVACAAGYRAAYDRYATVPKVRFATEDVVLHR